jgi:rubrerythrin
MDSDEEKRRKKLLRSMLATEMNALQQRENMMYDLYDSIYRELKDEDVKERIKLIRDQEMGHIRLVTEIISVIGEHMFKEGV